MRPKSTINIRRVDHEASSTHCWRVTAQRRTRVYGRNFSDSQHGGAHQALEAARVNRDRLNPCAFRVSMLPRTVSAFSSITVMDPSLIPSRLRKLFWTNR